MCSSKEDIKYQTDVDDHTQFVNNLSDTIGTYIANMVVHKTSKYAEYDELIEYMHNLPLVKKYKLKIEKLKKKNRKLKERILMGSENMRLVVDEKRVIVDLTGDENEHVNSTIKVVKVKLEPVLKNEVADTHGPYTSDFVCVFCQLNQPPNLCSNCGMTNTCKVCVGEGCGNGTDPHNRWICSKCVDLKRICENACKTNDNVTNDSSETDEFTCEVCNLVQISSLCGRCDAENTCRHCVGRGGVYGENEEWVCETCFSSLSDNKEEMEQEKDPDTAVSSKASHPVSVLSGDSTPSILAMPLPLAPKNTTRAERPLLEAWNLLREQEQEKEDDDDKDDDDKDDDDKDDDDKDDDEEDDDEEEEVEEEDDEEEEVEEEDDEEEEVEEITINSTSYYTNNVTNGKIYANNDGEVGDEVGHLKDGEAFFCE